MVFNYQVYSQLIKKHFYTHSIRNNLNLKIKKNLNSN